MLFGLACAVLTLARFLVPAESADEGDTLGIVVGWIALAGVAAWAAQREGRFRWRPSWPEAAVLCFVGPQIVSALALIATGGGNTRAALNMCWEWLGVAAAFVLLRVWCQDLRARSRLQALLLTAGVLLAGLGVWQRFVWYPQIQSDYLEWLDLGAGKRGHGPEVQARREVLQRELGPELLSLAGSSQAALRQRILDSQEPFGRFGLTNTFGGVLGVVLILLVGQWPQDRWTRWLIWGASVALVVTTLILTRSRTAWLATACGLLFLAVVRWQPSHAGSRVRELVRRVALGGIAVVPLIGLALVFGAVDKQDLVEAPKSVLYRVQYWTGSWPIIREHPLLGVGPGNFRSHYLRHKLPEASEEISDPHNLLLDVWTTGGVFGLLGILTVIGLAIDRWRMALGGEKNPPSANAEVQPAQWRWLCIVGWLTCAALFVAGYFFANRLDRQLLWLALAWGPVAFVVDRGLNRSASSAASDGSVLAAGLALMMHLLTSGGIAMPVISLLALTVLFVLPADRFERPPPAGLRWFDHPPAWLPQTLAVLAALLLAGSLTTGWGPVAIARIQMAAGNTVLHVDRRPQEAADLFRRATESDPRDPETWYALSFAEAALWQRGGRDASNHFESALAAIDRMIAADPVNPHGYRVRGELWRQRSRREQQPEYAARAAESYQQALDRYPHSLQILADLARALVDAGRPRDARAAAVRALELDQLFLSAGHFDKSFLPPEREELGRIAAQ